MPTIQDHISLDALTEGTLSTLKAIGVDDIAIMHPTPPEPGEDQSPLWRDVRRTVEAHGMRCSTTRRVCRMRRQPGLAGPTPLVLFGRRCRRRTAEVERPGLGCPDSDNDCVQPHLVVGRYSSHDRHFVAPHTGIN